MSGAERYLNPYDVDKVTTDLRGALREERDGLREEVQWVNACMNQQSKNLPSELNNPNNPDNPCEVVVEPTEDELKETALALQKRYVQEGQRAQDIAFLENLPKDRPRTGNLRPLGAAQGGLASSPSIGQLAPLVRTPSRGGRPPSGSSSKSKTKIKTKTKKRPPSGVSHGTVKSRGKTPTPSTSGSRDRLVSSSSTSSLSSSNSTSSLSNHNLARNMSGKQIQTSLAKQTGGGYKQPSFASPSANVQILTFDDDDDDDDISVTGQPNTSTTTNSSSSLSLQTPIPHSRSSRRPSSGGEFAVPAPRAATNNPNNPSIPRPRSGTGDSSGSGKGHGEGGDTRRDSNPRTTPRTPRSGIKRVGSVRIIAPVLGTPRDPSKGPPQSPSPSSGDSSHSNSLNSSKPSESPISRPTRRISPRSMRLNNLKPTQMKGLPVPRKPQTPKTPLAGPGNYGNGSFDSRERSGHHGTGGNSSYKTGRRSIDRVTRVQ